MIQRVGMRSGLLVCLMCVIAIGAFLAVAGGCKGLQGAGETVACPHCGSAATLARVEDVKDMKCVCPTCGRESGEIWDGYTSINSRVPACEKCGVTIAPCPHCRGHN